MGDNDDEEKDERPAVARSDAPPEPKWSRPPTEEAYEALWREFRGGKRTKTPLAEAVGVHRRVARTAIEHGWPERGWASLRARLELFEKQAAAARQKQEVAEAILSGRTTAQAWRQFADKTMDVALATADSLHVLSKKVRAACDAATFVRYRKVRSVIQNADGTQSVAVTDQAYVDAVAVAKALSQVAAAARESAAGMAFIVGPGRLEGTDAPELTQEQLDALGRGEMPADLNVTMLARALLSGTLIAKAGAEGGDT